LNRGILARLFDLGSVPTGKLPFLSFREEKKKKECKKKKHFGKKKCPKNGFHGKASSMPQHLQQKNEQKHGVLGLWNFRYVRRLLNRLLFYYYL